MNGSSTFSNNDALADGQLALVAGGDARTAGETVGRLLGQAYWGARDYLSETVYPYWLD